MICTVMEAGSECRSECSGGGCLPASYCHFQMLVYRICIQLYIITKTHMAMTLAAPCRVSRVTTDIISAHLTVSAL
jgi:hypothetical protein